MKVCNFFKNITCVIVIIFSNILVFSQEKLLPRCPLIKGEMVQDSMDIYSSLNPAFGVILVTSSSDSVFAIFEGKVTKVRKNSKNKCSITIHNEYHTVIYTYLSETNLTENSTINRGQHIGVLEKHNNQYLLGILIKKERKILSKTEHRRLLEQCK